MPVGVLVNSSAVLLGGIFGVLIGKKMPANLTKQLPTIFGLCAIAISITLITQIESLTPVVLAIIGGTVFGEIVGIEKGLKQKINKLVLKTGYGNEHSTDTLTTMVVLFCFSGVGIFGALNEGFTGDGSILIAKSVLDFFTAMIFGATAGLLVALISIPQCIIGFLLFYCAELVVPLLSSSMLGDFKACGGIIALAAGLKVSNIKKTNMINMLPSLILVLVFSYLWQLTGF